MFIIPLVKGLFCLMTPLKLIDLLMIGYHMSTIWYVVLNELTSVLLAARYIYMYLSSKFNPSHILAVDF